MKKGFTLVELLAVLTLLAFVALISVPIMDTILDSSRKKTKDSQIKEIIDATQKYVIKYGENINFDEDNEYLLSLKDLKKTEFLNDEKYINPETKKELNGCIYINYNKETSKYKYAYMYSCNKFNDNSSNSCFTFDSVTQTITGRNTSKEVCNIGNLIFPTSIDGVKVRRIASSATSYISNNSLGGNLFFGSMEMGSINETTGDKEERTDKIRCVEFIPVEAQKPYYIERLGILYKSFGFRYYDSNKNYLNNSTTVIEGSSGSKYMIFMTPENAAYMKIMDQSVNLNNKYYLGKISNNELIESRLDFSKLLYLEEIGNDAFRTSSNTSFKSIKELDLSNNSLLNSIGDNAFEGNTLKIIDSIKLPDNIENIGVGAFRGNNISKLIIPNKLKRIQEQAFYNNNIDRIEIPTNIITLGSKCFGKNKLKSVTIDSKTSSNDFTLYIDPFAENDNFTDSSIIWKN